MPSRTKGPEGDPLRLSSDAEEAELMASLAAIGEAKGRHLRDANGHLDKYMVLRYCRHAYSENLTIRAAHLRQAIEWEGGREESKP